MSLLNAYDIYFPAQNFRNNLHGIVSAECCFFWNHQLLIKLFK